MPEVSSDRLGGCRVLVVEDEYFIADDLARALKRAGADVVGPVPSCEDALRLLAGSPVDVAVLDINLSDETVYPLADKLRQQHIPFFFTTGFGQAAVREDFRDVPRWQKPYDEVALAQALIGRRQGSA